MKALILSDVFSSDFVTLILLESDFQLSVIKPKPK